MPAIHIRDVPHEVLAALKRRAAAHNRSLQGELRHVLAELALEGPPEERLAPLVLNLSDAPDSATTWSRDEIYGDSAR